MMPNSGAASPIFPAAPRAAFRTASPLISPTHFHEEPFSDIPTDVRYLSQQSVERLCSSDNLGRELLVEIEKVVFEAIPEEDRLSASDFAELRGLRLEQILRARVAHLDT